MSEMSPDELMKYLRSNKQDEYKESRVREILKTDIVLTDAQLEYLYKMLECIDKAKAAVYPNSSYMNIAKGFAKLALDSDLTDRRLIANIYKVLSTECFFSN